MKEIIVTFFNNKEKITETPEENWESIEFITWDCRM
jgi:hypothetical protein